MTNKLVKDTTKINTVSIDWASGHGELNGKGTKWQIMWKLL
jgi:hypothetical protein